MERLAKDLLLNKLILFLKKLGKSLRILKRSSALSASRSLKNIRSTRPLLVTMNTTRSAWKSGCKTIKSARFVTKKLFEL
jgi:hypothetical protein